MSVQDDYAFLRDKAAQGDETALRAIQVIHSLRVRFAPGRPCLAFLRADALPQGTGGWQDAQGKPLTEKGT